MAKIFRVVKTEGHAKVSLGDHADVDSAEACADLHNGAAGNPPAYRCEVVELDDAAQAAEKKAAEAKAARAKKREADAKAGK